MRAVTPILDRILAKVDVGLCWEWTGAILPSGYGVVSRGRRLGSGRVHRLLWEELVGPIPRGHDLDHLCRNRRCCNPDHLQPVTRQVNVDRGSHAAGRPRATSCSKGHPFTPHNTKTNGKSRTCRECANERNRQWRLQQQRTAA